MSNHVAENGRLWTDHDGCTEWSVCGKCGESIDWSNDVMFGRQNFETDDAWEESRDDTTCPYCGHENTAYIYASELAISDLWLDANQGQDANDRAFGYIGTDEEYDDEGGDSQEYCGWFFTWPSQGPGIYSESQRQSVIDSLETEDLWKARRMGISPTSRHNDEIPHELAVEKLTAYLTKEFPGNLDGEN